MMDGSVSNKAWIKPNEISDVSISSTNYPDVG